MNADVEDAQNDSAGIADPFPKDSVRVLQSLNSSFSSHSNSLCMYVWLYVCTVWLYRCLVSMSKVCIICMYVCAVYFSLILSVIIVLNTCISECMYVCMYVCVLSIR